MVEFDRQRRWSAVVMAAPASMVSELSLAIAHDDDPDDEFAYWRSALRSGGRLRSGDRIGSDTQRRSNPWDPRDGDDLEVSPDLESEWDLELGIRSTPLIEDQISYLRIRSTLANGDPLRGR